MRKHLHKLQQQPEHVRIRYAYVSAGIITLFIFSLWVTSIVVTKPFAYNKDGEQNTNIFAEDQNTLKDFAGTFKTGLANVSTGLESIQVPSQTEGPARLEIVETKRSSTIDTVRPTTISF